MLGFDCHEYNFQDEPSFAHEIRTTMWCLCSSFRFPFVGVRSVICYSAVLLLSLFFPLLPVVGLCSPFLLHPLPFSDLSSHNPPILPVVFLVFCNLIVYLSQIFLVHYNIIERSSGLTLQFLTCWSSANFLSGWNASLFRNFYDHAETFLYSLGCYI